LGVERVLGAKGHISTSTSTTRQVTASVAPEARKYLKEKCVAVGKNDVPPAPLVLGAFAKDGRLGSVYPRKQDVFVHRNINRPPCPASANHCLSNFTVLRSPEVRHPRGVAAGRMVHTPLGEHPYRV
jgi:hypothetical protein